MRLAKWEPFKGNLDRWDPMREFEDMADRLNQPARAH